MALTEEKNERLTTILQNLEPELKNLTGSSRGFVEDQIKRHEQYGDRMFMSLKQWAWLEDLYQTHCGGKAETPVDNNIRGRDEDDEPVSRRDDIDDEIPF